MRLKTNSAKIDWESPDSHYFFNPRQPRAPKLKALSKKLPLLKGHIYIFSSGGEKICLLSKSAFLASAKAVNKNLQAGKKDRWLVSLPLFHVGGLSILARSFCGGFSAPRSKSLWRAAAFSKELRDKKISLCSLVPAQIYDLAKAGLKPPKSLRALVAGGDSLSPWLYKKARGLGWPILLSYGLTEACSQVASSNPRDLSRRAFPKMKVLDHIKIKLVRGKAKIKSESLLSACFDIQKKKLYDPKDSKGWLELADNILLRKKELVFKGRKGDLIKILGESADLRKLSSLLEGLSKSRPGEFRLLAFPDPRQGYELALISSSFDIRKARTLAKAFNRKVSPYERIKSLCFAAPTERPGLLKASHIKSLRLLGF